MTVLWDEIWRAPNLLFLVLVSCCLFYGCNCWCIMLPCSWKGVWKRQVKMLLPYSPYQDLAVFLEQMLQACSWHFQLIFCRLLCSWNVSTQRLVCTHMCTVVCIYGSPFIHHSSIGYSFCKKKTTAESDQSVPDSQQWGLSFPVAQNLGFSLYSMASKDNILFIEARSWGQMGNLCLNLLTSTG